MRDYVMSGVTEKAEEDNAASNPCYYVPHQAIMWEETATIKVSIPFDASSSRIPGSSLNRKSETGPYLNQDIVSILMNFRRHRVALSKDVEKAFLQVGTDERDQDTSGWLCLEAIPVIEKSFPKMTTRRMTWVTFGMAASTFLLAATIQHHLRTVEREFLSTARLMRLSISGRCNAGSSVNWRCHKDAPQGQKNISNSCRELIEVDIKP